MILTHLQTLESQLVARLRGAAPAELAKAVLNGFAEPMFGGTARLRPGAVVGLASLPDDAAPRFDLVMSTWDAPTLALADGSAAWLTDSVLAGIQLVPQIDEDAMAAAVCTAAAAKALQRRAVGPVAPPLRCYLLAADGPANMLHTHAMLKLAYRRQGVTEADMPETGAERCRVGSPALDGVFVLGQGFLNFDNMPFGLLTDEARALAFGACWAVATSPDGSLVSLWLQLQQAVDAMAGHHLDLAACAEGFAVPGLRFAN